MTDLSNPNVGAHVDFFTNMACGEFPPHPPGWDEWWQKHRTEVAKTIEEAQASARRTVHYRLLKRLEAHGLQFRTLPDSPLTTVVREILDYLDEDNKKDEKEPKFKASEQDLRDAVKRRTAEKEPEVETAQERLEQLSREVAELKEKLKNAPNWCPGCGQEISIGSIHVCGGRGGMWRGASP